MHAHNQHVLVFVHDQAAEEITFRIDDAKGSRLSQVFAPHRQRRGDPALEKRLVHLDAVRREDANVDFRLRGVEADAQEALAMVLDLHQLAVGGGLGEPENRAVINPRMPGQDAVGFDTRASTVAWRGVCFLVLVAPFEASEPLLRLPGQSLSTVEAALLAVFAAWMASCAKGPASEMLSGWLADSVPPRPGPSCGRCCSTPSARSTR